MKWNAARIASASLSQVYQMTNSSSHPSRRRNQKNIMPIELRSDTYTNPSSEMRQAMANAVVGDDMVGEDPTVNELEARVTEMTGKQAAVFACSGTQSNQMAVWSHAVPGDELIIEQTGHIANYEAGGPAALRGVSVRVIPGDFGRLDLCHLEGNIHRDDIHSTPTKLLCIENSTNLGGGRTYPLDQLKRLRDWSVENGIPIHLDGARLFNACIANGYSPADVARNVDTVSFCFSKGLGCPMGSMLVGTREVIAKARRARKIFGGALRQAGIPAAACLYALDHHIDRLADDHANAKLFAESISRIDGIAVDVSAVETNLVFFELAPKHGTAAQLSAALKTRGVNLYPAGGTQRLRACTHMDVNREEIITAAKTIADCLNVGLLAEEVAMVY